MTTGGREASTTIRCSPPPRLCESADGVCCGSTGRVARLEPQTGDAANGTLTPARKSAGLLVRMGGAVVASSTAGNGDDNIRRATAVSRNSRPCYLSVYGGTKGSACPTNGDSVSNPPSMSLQLIDTVPSLKIDTTRRLQMVTSCVGDGILPV